MTKPNTLADCRRADGKLDPRRVRRWLRKIGRIATNRLPTFNRKRLTSSEVLRKTVVANFARLRLERALAQIHPIQIVKVWVDEMVDVDPGPAWRLSATRPDMVLAQPEEPKP